MKSHKITFATLLVLAIFFLKDGYSQKKEKQVRLKTVEYEVVTDATPEKAWAVLANYGNVASFHAGVRASKAINNTASKAYEGPDYLERKLARQEERMKRRGKSELFSS